jgi:phage-related baseplate assembly protein
MMSAGLLNLANILAPTLVEALDYEAILAAKLARLEVVMPGYAPLESDPAYKLLEIFAYDELLLRQRVNDAARGVMLAFAVGSDLEQIGARYDVARLPGESDSRLRMRIQQGYHLLAAAGPANAYKQHALGVSNDIIDVSVYSDTPGQVMVAVFGKQIINSVDATGNELLYGAAAFAQTGLLQTQAAIIARNDSALLTAVRVKLNAEDIRPLTDQVIVKGPTVKTFVINASLIIYRGPDPAVVLNESRNSLNTYLGSIKRLNFDATRAGIIAALTVPGVQNTLLTSPAFDVAVGSDELALPLTITVITGGVDD